MHGVDYKLFMLFKNLIFIFNKIP